MATTSAFYNKPELALRRAYELEEINQQDAALTTLHDVLSGRRYKTWSPADEQIMIAYLDMCLKMNRSREAKDGLHQYRNLSQTQAPGSLEKVIRYLMERAEQKCENAKAFADAEAVTTTIEEEDEDGFVGASPQAILLSTMSTDPEKAQRDSTLVLPSLKFLWETYRTVLDILRSNSKLEHVYHAAAQSAIRFCCNYKRRMEFRHLCDMLRTHLGNLRQYGNVLDTGDSSKVNNRVRGWEGWSNESIELHLRTRFLQLETASVLHRYAEGFRTCEDIFNILQISQARRKANPDLPPPKPKLMASYYEKLTALFWVSENYLFHAYAWYKFYSLCKEYNRGMNEETKRLQASTVLLAALCIPSTPNHSGSGYEKKQGIASTVEDNITKHKMSRMATLLGFHTRNPTRAELLREIHSKNILDQVPQYLGDLYFLLEESSDPLVLVEKAQPLLEKLRSEVGSTTVSGSKEEGVEETPLGRYVEPLTSVLLLKLVTNLSSAYQTVSIAHFKRLTEGLSLSFDEVEKAIVNFTQFKLLSARIDHRAGCLRFGEPRLEADDMRSNLTILAKHLGNVTNTLHPLDASSVKAQRSALFSSIRENLGNEHAAMLDRKQIIEKRKEEAERLIQDKIKEEARRKADKEAARRAEEAQRIAREHRQREIEKQKKIKLELEKQEKKRVLAAMGKKAEDISDEQIAKIDTDALQREHQEKLNKKKEEAERKTMEAAKKLDYLVRAIRIEELPLIKKDYEENRKAAREHYEQEVMDKAEKARKQWFSDVSDRKTLEEHNVFSFMSMFEDLAMVKRKKTHAELCRMAEEDAEFNAEKEKLQRARKRKEEFLQKQARKEALEQERLEEERLEKERAEKEALRREREAKEEERRQEEDRRMDQERSRTTSSSENKYVPPSRRREGFGGSSNSGGVGGGGSRFGGGSGRYPGGGRYEGHPRSNPGSGTGGSDQKWR